MALIGEAALIVGTIAAVAGTAVAVVGQQQQAKAAKQTADFNAKVANNNALAAQQAAAYEASQIRRKNLLRLGTQRAIAGKSGIETDAGGSLDDVIYDSAIQGELDAQAALYSGQVRSNADRSAASLARFEGSQAQAAAGIGAASSIIGGLAGVGSSFGNYAAARQRYPTVNSSGPTYRNQNS